MPGMSGRAGHIYDIVRDYATTIVFLCMVVAAVRRLVFKPARYAVPARHGKAHTGDAIFLLALIAILMGADSLFEASQAAAQVQQRIPAEFMAAFSLPWVLQQALIGAPLAVLSELEHRRVLPARIYVLLPAVLSALRHTVPRGDVAIQYLLREVRPGDTQAGAMGYCGRAAGPGEILRRQDVRGLHLEAHARFLLLRRLRPLLGPVSGECGGKAAVSQVPHHQGARLQLPALPGSRDFQQRHAADWQHLFGG